ncbi:MAG: IS3 family transposase [Gemmatimonadota bacterium]|nr:IS3 family transposase [Gemmatimonadota bacterium]
MSPATGTRYPMTLICSIWRVARSSVYACWKQMPAGASQPQARKRGPKTRISDAELVEEIRAVLKESPFLGEGHKKVTLRLRHRGIRVGKNRVLRLMRENRLLAPVRQRHKRGDPTHSGTIRTEQPDQMWGTDATRFWTEEEGWCWFFGAIDHCTDEIVGHHVAKKGDRWAALEPVRQGVRRHFGGFAPKIALGLGLRHDWGPQYTAHQFNAELKWLGIRNSPAFVGEPECNGLIERFMRTLKEECIYVHRFRTLEEARFVIGRFIQQYNSEWLLQRHGYKTPAEVRKQLTRKAA